MLRMMVPTWDAGISSAAHPLRAPIRGRLLSVITTCNRNGVVNRVHPFFADRSAGAEDGERQQEDWIWHLLSKLIGVS